MAKVTTSYESTDGKVFATEAEADIRDMELAMTASIDSYVAYAKLTKADATRARRHIGGYAFWVAAQAAAAEISARPTASAA